MYNKPVPVLMYHSVGVPNKIWNFNYLTCPYEIFEDQLKWMKNRGFNSIFLEELYEYMSNNTPIPKKSVVLTFDDGYGDNWIFAYPLLKKYGMKATIYINPDFVGSRKEKLNLEDVYDNNARLEDLDTLGYLSWEELKIMEEEGLVDIQSHTMTHTWYPKSNKIIDFRHSYDPYLWMTWNDKPDKKPSLQIDNQNLIKYGQPVYEHGRSIGIKRYFPDENLDNYLVDYFEDKSDELYFDSEGWKEKLFIVMKDYKDKNLVEGRFETEEEYEKRIHFELYESKKLIENKLDKEVKFLCWPGGAVTPKALEIALAMGYLSSTIGKDIENDKKYLKNIHGEDPSRINRMYPVLYWDGQENAKSHVKYKNGFYSVISLYQYKEKFPSFLFKSTLYFASLWNGMLLNRFG